MTSTAATQVQLEKNSSCARERLQASSLLVDNKGYNRCHPAVPSSFADTTRRPQDVAMEAEEEKDTQESSLYKEDSFRMYCMKVVRWSTASSRRSILTVTLRIFAQTRHVDLLQKLLDNMQYISPLTCCATGVTLLQTVLS